MSIDRQFPSEVEDLRPQRPIPPPCRLIKEGGGVDFCKTCGSTQKRAWFGLGRVIGCIQPKCWNYYRWRSLPVGVNPPAGLYGGPEKPPAPPMPPCKPPGSAAPVAADDVRRIVREELRDALRPAGAKMGLPG